jgi:hypothetical protein
VTVEIIILRFKTGNPCFFKLAIMTIKNICQYLFTVALKKIRGSRRDSTLLFGIEAHLTVVRNTEKTKNLPIHVSSAK